MESRHDMYLFTSHLRGASFDAYSEIGLCVPGPKAARCDRHCETDDCEDDECHGAHPRGSAACKRGCIPRLAHVVGRCGDQNSSRYCAVGNSRSASLRQVENEGIDISDPDNGSERIDAGKAKLGLDPGGK